MLSSSSSSQAGTGRGRDGRLWGLFGLAAGSVPTRLELSTCAGGRAVPGVHDGDTSHWGTQKVSAGLGVGQGTGSPWLMVGVQGPHGNIGDGVGTLWGRREGNLGQHLMWDVGAVMGWRSWCEGIAQV